MIRTRQARLPIQELREILAQQAAETGGARHFENELHENSSPGNSNSQGGHEKGVGRSLRVPNGRSGGHGV